MTASHTSLLPTPMPLHEHGWITESAHRTSEGEIVYVRCAGCGAHRVDLRTPQTLPPTAQTRAISAARR